MNFHSPMTRFGRGGSILRSKDVALSDDQLRQAVPSIFAGDKHGSRSDRYTYIPTIEVLNGLRSRGFDVFEARQGGSSDVEKRGFTKHMLKLRQSGSARPRVVGDCVQEVILINAHDGTSSYQLAMGWFRLICLNGMMVADKDKGGFGVRVPHKGDIVGQVIDGAFEVVEEGGRQGQRIEAMQQVLLSSPEQGAFAKAAAELRFGETSDVNPQHLLVQHRPADAGADLWRTFNRVQENVIRGGVGYTQRSEDGRRMAFRHTKPVNGIDGDVKLNRAMWVLAEEMAKIKAAA